MDLLKDRRSIIDRSHDFLGQAGALDTLLHAIDELKPAACLAVYGSWGAGKTALLNTAYEEIRAGGRHRAVWFDPWPYERHHDVLAMLMLTMLQDLGLGPTRWAQLKEHVVRLLKPLFILIGRMTPGLIAAAHGAPDAAATLSLNRLDVGAMADRLATEGQLEDDVRALRASFRTLVTEVLEDQEADGARLVVFLDDLDRCMPDRALWLIEAIKLLLADGDEGAPAVFVFGLDRQIVGEAIRVRYPATTLYTGENYLEKIFDLSLEAPPIAPDPAKLEHFIHHVGGERALATVVDAIHGDKEALLGVLCSPVFANPRVIKRVVNRLFLLARAGALPRMSLNRRAAVAWIAGTERFRTFRHFFVGASTEELIALDAAVCTATRTDVATYEPPPRVAAFVDTPGFVAFYRDLLLIEGTGQAGAALLRQREESNDGDIRTLFDLDLYLRRFGL